MPRLGPAALRAFVQVAPKQIECELFPGVTAELDLTDETQRSAFWLGRRFEHPTGTILQQWTARDGAVFFDIGSNFGLFSFLLLSQNSRVPVISFEPNPATFATLERISRRNHLGARHTLVNAALGSSLNQMDLFPGITDSGHSTLGNHPDLAAQRTIKVDVFPLTHWLLSRPELTRPNRPAWVAKIDVEGFELEVLRGMRPLLEAKCFAGICVEINAFTLNLCRTSPTEVREFLRDCGYANFLKTPAGKEFALRPSGNEFFVPA